MKKNIRVRVITGAMAISMLASMSAFAENTKDVPVTTKEDVSPIDNTKESKEVKEGKYIGESGKISSIKKAEGYTTITITNDNMGLVLNLADEAFLINRLDNSYMKAEDLKEGMTITAILEKNSPMTMSIPPMTSGAIGVIVNTDKGSVAIDKFDDKLFSNENNLILNIDKDTQIADTTGAKRIFTAEDVKNSNAIVFYDITTRSIPAQTSPSYVLIVAEKEEAEKEETQKESVPMEVIIPSTPATEPKAIIVKDSVALRTAAESAGFKITWTANDKPVILEKDGIKIEIQVGNTSYTKNNEKLEASKPTELKDSKIYISADIAEILK